MATLSELKIRTYSILGEDQLTSSLYPDDSSDTLVTDTINQATADVCSRYPYSFLIKESFFEVVKETTLSTACSTGATVLTVSDTTSFPSSGKLMIDQEIITYTGKTTTTFTGVSGVTVAHSAGVKVYFLYTLPTDFARYLNGQIQFSTGGQWMKAELADWYDFDTDRFSAYQIAVNETSGVIRLSGAKNIQTSQGKFVLRYFMSPLVLSSSTDVCTIPGLHAMEIIPLLTAGILIKTRGDNIDGLGDEKIQQAESAISRLQAKYTHKNTFDSFVRTKYGAFSSMRRNNTYYQYNAR